MRTDFPDLSAVERAINQCEKQIARETDRLVKQTKLGIDPSASRRLLFAYHESLMALKRAKRVLEKPVKASPFPVNQSPSDRK